MPWTLYTQWSKVRPKQNFPIEKKIQNFSYSQYQAQQWKKSNEHNIPGRHYKQTKPHKIQTKNSNTIKTQTKPIKNTTQRSKTERDCSRKTAQAENRTISPGFMSPSNKQAHNKHRAHRNETVRPFILNNINGDVDGEPLNKSRTKALSDLPMGCGLRKEEDLFFMVTLLTVMGEVPS